MNALVEAGNGWLWKQLIFEASHVFFFSLFFPQKATTSLTFGKLPFVHFLSFSPPPAPFPGHRGTNPGFGMDEPAVSFPPGRVPPRQEAGKQLLDRAQGEALFAGDSILGMGLPQLPRPSGARTMIQGGAGVQGVWENQAGTSWV